LIAPDLHQGQEHRQLALFDVKERLVSQVFASVQKKQITLGPKRANLWEQ
jgi:hypothetical protein